jgi:hypothetical protein
MTVEAMTMNRFIIIAPQRSAPYLWGTNVMPIQLQQANTELINR